MADNLIFILPVVTLLLFLLNVLFYGGNNVQSCLIFILCFLPLMNLKITKEAWGGFRTFDAITFYCIIFLFKDFIKFNIKNNGRFYFLLFIMLSIVIILGGLVSEFPNNPYFNLVRVVPIFIFCRFFILECKKDPEFHRKAIRALKVSYLVCLGFLFVQMIVGLRFTFYPELHNNVVDPDFNMIRYPGIFYDSQVSGQYLAMGSFLFLYAEEGWTRKRLWLNYLIYPLALAGVFFAGSRSAVGGLSVGLIFVFLFAGKQFRMYRAIIIVLLIIGALFALSPPASSPQQGIIGRTANASQDYQFRQSLWKEAFGIAEKYPFLGVGYGNYQSYVMKYAQDQYLEIEPGTFLYFDQPENGYLKIAVELGFIGLALVMLFILVPLVNGLVYYVKGITDKRSVLLMASLVTWLVAFNTLYSISEARILIMVASMTVLIIAYPLKKLHVYEPEEYQAV